MVEMAESGTGEGEGISETGISISVEPTTSGPGYSGRVGTGLRCENMLRPMAYESRDLGEINSGKCV